MYLNATAGPLSLCLGTLGLAPPVLSFQRVVVFESWWIVKYLPFSSQRPSWQDKFISGHFVCVYISLQIHARYRHTICNYSFIKFHQVSFALHQVTCKSEASSAKVPLPPGKGCTKQKPTDLGQRRLATKARAQWSQQQIQGGRSPCEHTSCWGTLSRTGKYRQWKPVIQRVFTKYPEYARHCSGCCYLSQGLIRGLIFRWQTPFYHTMPMPHTLLCAC